MNGLWSLMYLHSENKFHLVHHIVIFLLLPFVTSRLTIDVAFGSEPGQNVRRDITLIELTSSKYIS